MDTFLPTEEVEKRLSVHRNTVIRYIRDGRLQATKVGNAYRIRESSLAAFLGEATPRDDKAMVFAVANQKGGVAKTTTAVNLAASLSALGSRVLLIDLDPQGGCAVCLGIDTYALQRTIYNALVSSTVDIAKITMTTLYGFDLAPSNIDLAGAEVELINMLAKESILRRRLQPLLDIYDYIVIDTPPNLGVLTVNALTAARYVVIPVACEFMALRGLRMLLDTIANVRSVTNPDLRVLGVLATKYEARTLNSREVHDFLAHFCDQEGLRLFDQVIKLSVRITEAPNTGRPVVDLYPDLDGAQAYRQVAKEIANA